MVDVVSIHARVKRATIQGVVLRVDSPVSIHARVKRATTGDDAALLWSTVSIHARVKRATCGAMSTRWWLACFNPRPREAGDWTTQVAWLVSSMFQSTPA